MLYTRGQMRADVSLYNNVYKENKGVQPKSLASLKFLDKDQCCFTKNVSKADNVKNVTAGVQKHITPHDNPYVLVHGTIVKEDTLFTLRDTLKPSVSSIDLQAYPNITDTKRIEDSAQIVSRNVNKVRINVTKDKLNQLSIIKKDPAQLQQFFKINTNSSDAGRIVELLPGVIDDIEAITRRSHKDLQESFSTRVKQVELKLAADIEKTGFGSWNESNKAALCQKAAEEIINTIAPKAVLVGHSLGGLVGHVMAVNPKKVDFDKNNELTDKSHLTYDAGNGVAMFVSLGSPVENGTELESAGMREARYDWCDETIIRPFEKAWSGLLSFNIPWLIGKMNFKQNCENFSHEADIKPASDPKFLKEKPGFVQMSKDSDFLKENVIGKHTQTGVSSLSYYHPGDKFMDLDCIKLNEKHVNNHNIKVNFDITDEVVDETRGHLGIYKAVSLLMESISGKPLELTDNEKMIKSLYAHDVLTFQPQEFLKSFKEGIVQHPETAIRMLDLDNSDTLRCQCLDVIYDQVQKNSAFLNDKPELLDKIAQVSAEKIPFESSPSYKANQILELS